MIMAVTYATFAVAKRKPKKIQAFTGFEPLPSAISVVIGVSLPAQTGSRSLNWFVINP